MLAFPPGKVGQIVSIARRASAQNPRRRVLASRLKGARAGRAKPPGAGGGVRRSEPPGASAAALQMGRAQRMCSADPQLRVCRWWRRQPRSQARRPFGRSDLRWRVGGALSRGRERPEFRVRSVRVLVVSDSTSLVELSELLRASGVQVVGAASAAESALALMRTLQPSAVLLDLDALLLDALQLLPLLVRERLAPVVTFSGQAETSALWVRAVALGASEVLARGELLSWGDRKSQPSLSWSRVRAEPSTRPRVERVSGSQPAAALGHALIALGASTGGTVALTELLRQLPANSPPILIVQHMLAEFTHDFAEHLNAACAVEVKEAEDGEVVQRGHVLLARGGRHLRLQRAADGSLRARLSDEPPVGMHRPSVDVLFQSCAEVMGAMALGVLLTGMGEDGAAGLLAMRRAGARTVVQDESTSVCFGMPRAAIARGAAGRVLSLREIGRLLAG